MRYVLATTHEYIVGIGTDEELDNNLPYDWYPTIDEDDADDLPFC